MIDDIKIGESETCIFYKNMFCRQDDDYRIVLAEFKDGGKKEYLLLKNDDIVHHSQNIEYVY